MTPRRTAIPSACRAASSRVDSVRESAVGMETMTNSDRALSCSSACSCCIWSWNLCSARTACGSSRSAEVRGAALPPKTEPKRALAPPTRAAAPSNRLRKASSLSMKVSRKSGKVRRRSVCPVGAVSMTTRSKCTPRESACASSTTFASAMSSSTPGGTASKTSEKSERSSPPAPPLTPSDTPLSSCLNSSSASSTWTSRAYSDAEGPPSMRWASPSERSTSRASPNECAGSVLTMSVL
mmetsp:Transcript_5322/g.11706  ORF Transcript_5322/g.11706 Transcript_5322/m.11706 type:complete len:239 (-) Transcript_5322:397-1113(-)